jgi:hypothetical protein
MPTNLELRYIFLDFDETLFNHYKFLDWLDDKLYEHGHLIGGKGSFKDVIDDFHTVLSDKPMHRLYRHEDHMTQTTTQSWRQVANLIKVWLKEQNLDFCYPDAHDLLAWLITQPQDLRILTFGDQTYQHFKIQTCSYLSAKQIPIHVVLEDKAGYLKRHFTDGKGILVDDKYPLNLPANWHHIWLNRIDRLDKPKTITATQTQVASLDQVASALDNLKMLRSASL